MGKEEFKILITSLFNNNQLFIPIGQTLEEWIDNVYDSTLYDTVHDFMMSLDNYNIDIPTILYDEWNEVNKLVGRD